MLMTIIRVWFRHHSHYWCIASHQLASTSLPITTSITSVYMASISGEEDILQELYVVCQHSAPDQRLMTVVFTTHQA
jgi:hypothetical protein